MATTLIYQGAKFYWDTMNTLDVLLVEHENVYTTEVVIYDPALNREAPRLYLDSNLLYCQLNHDDIAQQVAIGSRNNINLDEDTLLNKAKFDFVLNHLVISEYDVESRHIRVKLHSDDSGKHHNLFCPKPYSLLPFKSPHYYTLMEDLCDDATVDHMRGEQPGLVNKTEHNAQEEEYMRPPLSCRERWRIPLVLIKVVKIRPLSISDSELWHKILPNKVAEINDYSCSTSEIAVAFAAKMQAVLQAAEMPTYEETAADSPIADLTASVANDTTGVSAVDRACDDNTADGAGATTGSATGTANEATGCTAGIPNCGAPALSLVSTVVSKVRPVALSVSLPATENTKASRSPKQTSATRSTLSRMRSGVSRQPLQPQRGEEDALKSSPTNRSMLKRTNTNKKMASYRSFRGAPKPNAIAVSDADAIEEHAPAAPEATHSESAASFAAVLANVQAVAGSLRASFGLSFKRTVKPFTDDGDGLDAVSLGTQSVSTAWSASQRSGDPFAGMESERYVMGGNVDAGLESAGFRADMAAPAPSPLAVAGHGQIPAQQYQEEAPAMRGRRTSFLTSLLQGLSSAAPSTSARYSTSQNSKYSGQVPNVTPSPGLDSDNQANNGTSYILGDAPAAPVYRRQVGFPLLEYVLASFASTSTKSARFT